jgi:hypothetical protein
MNNRNWNILCWNIRGINGVEKWDAVRNKIEESSCSVIYLQETKKEAFDMSFIHNFVPKRFDKFELIPSVGASGGILVLWNSSVFVGQVLDMIPFGLTVDFTSVHNHDFWKLTIVYGPCHEPQRSEFVAWIKS